MAYDKIVDSTALDGAMTATADAIRAKTGSTAQIPWNSTNGFSAEMDDVYDSGFDNAINIWLSGGAGSLDTIVDDRATRILAYVFYYRTIPRILKCTSAKYIGVGVFMNNSSIERVELPNMNQNFNDSAFRSCSSLKAVDIGAPVQIPANGFRDSSKLKVVIIRKTSVLAITNTTAFSGTPFASGGSGGTVLVPRSLITTYQGSTNWSALYTAGSTQFLALEDYTLDGTITGEPDWDKIEQELMT